MEMLKTLNARLEPRRLLVLLLLLFALVLSSCAGDKPDEGIGDFVWVDANSDGIQNDDEKGFANVSVRLIDEADVVQDELKTDRRGYFEFKPRVIGKYYLQFVAPAGYRFTPADKGNDNTDSDAFPIDGTTAVFTYDGETPALSWDAGLIPSPGIEQTSEPSPSPTATETPSPGQALKGDAILMGSRIIDLQTFNDVGMIDLNGRWLSTTLTPEDPFFRSDPFILIDPFGGLYFGMAGDQEGLSLNLSVFFPGDGVYQPSLFGNFAREEDALPSFEAENRSVGDDPDVLSSDDLLLTRLEITVEEIREATAISLWIYRLKFDENGRIGYELIHVALSKTELNSILDLADELGDFDEEDLSEIDEVSIIGTILSYADQELVKVSTREVLDALDEAVDQGRIDRDPELAAIWNGYGDWVREGSD